jgi:hypothetical protein
LVLVAGMIGILVMVGTGLQSAVDQATS